MGRIEINRERCKGCGLCVANCKQGLIVIDEAYLNALGYRPACFQDGDVQCKACRICAEMCPDCAIEVYK